jgi:hypothetical protein
MLCYQMHAAVDCNAVGLLQEADAAVGYQVPAGDAATVDVYALLRQGAQAAFLQDQCHNRIPAGGAQDTHLPECCLQDCLQGKQALSLSSLE